MKKGVVIFGFVFLLIFFLSSYFVSAFSFGEVWNKITGKVVDESILSNEITLNIGKFSDYDISNDLFFYYCKDCDDNGIYQYNITSHEKELIKDVGSGIEILNLRASGDNIIWTSLSEDSQKYELYLYNIQTKIIKKVTEIDNPPSIISSYGSLNIIFNGDNIAWLEYSKTKKGDPGKFNIYLYNILTNQKTEIVKDLTNGFNYENVFYADYPNMAISTDYFIWSKIVDDIRIFNIYKISTGETTELKLSSFDIGGVSTYGDKIVWDEYRNYNMNIFMYDISEKKERQITASIGDIHNTEPVIYRNKIFWYTRNRNSFEGDLNMHDIKTDEKIKITSIYGSFNNFKVKDDNIIFCKVSGCWQGEGFNLIKLNLEEKPKCVLNCVDKSCGDDGCGGNCGTCITEQTCNNGNCVTLTSSCAPNCVGKTCGDDSCGGSCGTCEGGYECTEWNCIKSVTDCIEPYHKLTLDGECIWNCEEGTEPGLQGECICKTGYIKTGVDDSGRIICIAIYNPQNTICSDSDGGLDYYKKGKITIEGKEGSLSDICVIKTKENSYISSFECNGDNCFLEETDCDSPSESYRLPFPVSYYKCPDSCREGVCTENYKENKKDLSLYSDKEIFLISDKNWQEVLPWVSATTWTEISKNNEEISGDYIIRNKYSKLVVEGFGTYIYQSPNYFSDNLIWNFISLGENYYKIINKQTGKCLDVQEASIEDKAKIQQKICSEADSQKWKLESTGEDNYKIINKNSEKVLELEGEIRGTGSSIQQGNYLGWDFQQWKIEPQINYAGGQIFKYPFLIYHYLENPSLDISDYYFDTGTNSYYELLRTTSLSSTNLKAGDNLTVTFKFKNIGSENILLPQIALKVIDYPDYPKLLSLISKPDFIERSSSVFVVNENFAPGEEKTYKFVFHVSYVPPILSADSAIYLMQQYSPDSLTIIGDTPEELNNLLIAEPELGAGIKQENIQRINPNDYLSYWKSYKDVVYVEDNYELALLASTYASLLNAPLIIQGTSNDNAQVLQGKNIICVGSVSPSGNSCKEQYTLEQLRQEYIVKTNTDKIILVNPNDLLEKDSDGAMSLTAPILASAKQELILSTTSQDYNIIDKLIEDFYSVYTFKYLTIIAKDIQIPLREYMWKDGEYDIYRALDPTEYADMNDDMVPDIAVGRIIGETNADVSGYITRVLFYDSFSKDNYRNVKVISGDELRHVNIANPIVTRFKEADYNVLLTIFSFMDAMVDLKDVKSFEWKNQYLIAYIDHGGSDWAGTSLKNLPLLDNSFIFTSACDTCPDSTSFCTRAIRNGALSYLGAVSVAYTVNGKSYPAFYGTINGLFSGSTIGDSFRTSYGNVEKHWYMYTLIGDPTIYINPSDLLKLKNFIP